MDLKPDNIPLLALYDPIAAYALSQHIPRIPFVMNCAASFSSFALDQLPIEGDLDTVIPDRTWIARIDYSLAQPNVFSGNVFKTLYDSNLKAAPGVSVRVSVHSGPRYLVAPNFTPLENFANVILDTWPAGWVLYKQQSIKAEFILTQAPPSVSPNAPPYNIVLTFTGWQFLDPSLDNMDPNDAAQRLRDAGYCVPTVGECKKNYGNAPTGTPR
jgi:hypothetical protein